MKSLFVVGLVLLTACAPGPDDLTAIKAIRSAAAEWALVNREGARGRLTHSYIAGMRQAARQEIDQQAAALKDRNSPAMAHANALRVLPDDAPAMAIEYQADALEQIERSLELS